MEEEEEEEDEYLNWYILYEYVRTHERTCIRINMKNIKRTKEEEKKRNLIKIKKLSFKLMNITEITTV